MSYGSEQTVLSGAVGKTDMPELGHLKAAVERVAITRHIVECFAERFFGPQPANGEAVAPALQGYRNDIESLFEQISRLEKVVGALDRIG